MPRTSTTRRSDRRPIGLIKGFRSGLEDVLADQIRQLGHPVRYEELELPYVEPVVQRKYTPDFLLGETIVVESKGYFPLEDRQKMILVRDQNPHLDFRLVFTNPATFLQTSDRKAYSGWLASEHGRKRGNPELYAVWRATKKTARATVTYAEWAIKHGFKYAEKLIPDAWFAEAFGAAT